jgi:hypothetical protein
MYGYGKRHIKVDESTIETEVTGDAVKTGDPGFPKVGLPILNLYKKLTGKSKNFLSSAQVETLKRRTDKPSPEEEYAAFPTEFTMFIHRIPEHPAYKARTKSERITTGMLIDILSHYDWKGGWSQYRPKNAPPPIVDILEIGLGDYNE